MKVTEKTGEIIGAVTVEPQDELMLMTSGGLSIRIRVQEVRETGRNAQGVKLLSMKEGERLQDIAKVIPDGDDATVEVTENRVIDEVQSEDADLPLEFEGDEFN